MSQTHTETGPSAAGDTFPIPSVADPTPVVDIKGKVKAQDSAGVEASKKVLIVAINSR